MPELPDGEFELPYSVKAKPPAKKPAKPVPPPVDPKDRAAAVADLVGAMQASHAPQGARTVPTLLAAIEVIAVTAIHVVLLGLLQMASPEAPRLEQPGPNNSTRHVWATVHPRCWSPPEWPELLRQAGDVNATGHATLVGAGPEQHLRLDGLVSADVAARVHIWAKNQRHACLTVETTREDYTLLVKARWTPTTAADVERATTQLAKANAKVRKAQMLPVPLLHLQSADFPLPGLDVTRVKQALLSGGLRDFTVEAVADPAFDPDANAAWQLHAVLPVVKAERGALLLQALIYALLVALWTVMVRGRFATTPARPALPWGEIGRPLALGTAAALTLTLAVGVKIGLDGKLLHALAPQPDVTARWMGVVAFGVGLPVVNAVVVLGYGWRRMAEVLSQHGAIALMAVLYPAALWWMPVAPPETPQFYLLVPVAAVAGYLLSATGRLAAALLVVVAVQAVLAWVALGQVG